LALGDGGQEGRLCGRGIAWIALQLDFAAEACRKASA
jgi:hypothetical protein